MKICQSKGHENANLFAESKGPDMRISVQKTIDMTCKLKSRKQMT